MRKSLYAFQILYTTMGVRRVLTKEENIFNLYFSFFFWNSRKSECLACSPLLADTHDTWFFLRSCIFINSFNMLTGYRKTILSSFISVPTQNNSNDLRVRNVPFRDFPNVLHRVAHIYSRNVLKINNPATFCVTHTHDSWRAGSSIGRCVCSTAFSTTVSWLSILLGVCLYITYFDVLFRGSEFRVRFFNHDWQDQGMSTEKEISYVFLFGRKRRSRNTV